MYLFEVTNRSKCTKVLRSTMSKDRLLRMSERRRERSVVREKAPVEYERVASLRFQQVLRMLR